MIVLDANVLIGLLDPADANHAAAERLLLAHASEQFALSVLTFTEFLIRPTALGLASTAEAFVANMGVVVSPLLVDDARQLARMRTASGLKLPDAVVLWLAQASSAKVMTMDGQLAGTAAALGIDVVE